MSQQTTRRQTLQSALEAFERGDLDLTQAVDSLEATMRGFEEGLIGRFDTSREARTGVPEAIFAEGKTPEALCDALASAIDRQQQLIATRVTDAQLDALGELRAQLIIHPVARIISTQAPNPPADAPRLIVLAAGTSDLPVAWEAAHTSALFGLQVSTLFDVGVAGIHRLFNDLDKVRAAQIVIVVAGMDGALPSVVAGLVRAPVIAVPTSVGYGASFGGVSAMLTMLNTCAPGVAVCNIDNGFGAAALAKKIALLTQS